MVTEVRIWLLTSVLDTVGGISQHLPDGWWLFTIDTIQHPKKSPPCVLVKNWTNTRMMKYDENETQQNTWILSLIFRSQLWE